MKDKIIKFVKRLCPHLVKVNSMVVENTYYADGDYWNKEYVQRRVCTMCGKVLDA